MNAHVRHSWLPRPPAGDGPVLICFPHAGARWTVFRDWAEELSAPVVAAPADYPRDPRSGEIACASIEDLARTAQGALAPILDRGAVLYGHSFGAAVAFELARLMRRGGFRDPLGVIVSGNRAPGAPRRDSAAALPADEFLEKALSWGGFTDAIRADADLVSWFAKSLRADMALAEAHMMDTEPRLRCPLAAFSGLDDELAPPAEVAPWSQATSGPFSHDILPGNHFFPFNNRPQFLSRLDSRLREMAA